MFHIYIYYFPLLGSIGNSTNLCAIKCGTALLVSTTTYEKRSAVKPKTQATIASLCIRTKVTEGEIL